MVSPGAGVGEDSIDEYGHQNQENVNGQSGSSMLTFVMLPHMYVPDIPHDT